MNDTFFLLINLASEQAVYRDCASLIQKKILPLIVLIIPPQLCTSPTALSLMIMRTNGDIIQELSEITTFHVNI